MTNGPQTGRRYRTAAPARGKQEQPASRRGDRHLRQLAVSGVVLLAVVLALLLASRVSRQLVAPINDLDLNAPADAVCYCLLYTCPSQRDRTGPRMACSACKKKLANNYK